MPANKKSDLPFSLSENMAPCLGEEEVFHIHNLAQKLKDQDSKLLNMENFGPQVHQGYRPGPVIFYEDHRAIALSTAKSSLHYQYRLRLLARQQDIMLMENIQAPEFEAYCSETLNLPSPEMICLTKSEENAPLAKSCLEDETAMARLMDIGRKNGCLNIMPYLSTGWTWVLAQKIAQQADIPVYVMGPAPYLSEKTNDKLWFSERILDIFGPSALPETHYAFGPDALAIEVSRLAKDHSRIVVKIPSSASSVGNMVIETAPLKNMPLDELEEHLLDLVQFPGAQQIYPLAVSVWDSQVLTSPSLQIWIPEISSGPPLIEGLFEQALDSVSGAFIGARPAILSDTIKDGLLHEGSMIALLFQNLGYYGRCSLDSVICEKSGQKKIHWIECNGRWGGVSIPMTAAQNLTGHWQSDLQIIVQDRAQEQALPQDNFLKSTRDLHYNSSRKKDGIVILTPQNNDVASYHDYMILAKDIQQGQSLYDKVNKMTKTELIS